MGNKKKCQVSAWLDSGCEEAFAGMLRHPGAAMHSLTGELQGILSDTLVHKQPLARDEARCILQGMAACGSKTSHQQPEEADRLCTLLGQLDTLAKDAAMSAEIASVLSANSLLRGRLAFALNPQSKVRPSFDPRSAPVAFGLAAQIADVGDGLLLIRQVCGDEVAKNVQECYLNTAAPSGNGIEQAAIKRAQYYARKRQPA